MAGGVWVPVNAQMKGFVATVMKEASGAAKKSGKAFEDEFAKSGQKAGASLAKKVEAATNTLSRARSQEAQAAKELAVAEKELENLRSRGNASASQMIAAENKVATAKAKNEDASMRVARSEKDLEAARSGQSTTSNAVKRAEDNLSQARIASTDAAGKVRAAEAAVGEARDKAKAGAAGVAQAEQKVIDTRDRYGAGTKQTAAAERELEKAKKDADKANLAVTKAEGDLGKARVNLENATDQLAAKELRHKQSLKDVDEAQKNAGKSAKGLGDGMGILDGKLGAVAKSAGAAIAGFAGFSAIKNMAFDLGQQFSEMDRTIRAGTGASGAAFDELAESARRVATELPAADGDIKAIGSTLADLNTRLGVSGPELETLTKQFTALDTLGFEADINAASQALNGFGIEAKDMPAAMDDLFRVSQATGVSMDDLANSVTKGGPQLREFGFSLQDAAALTGLLDKAGLDANKTIAGMGRSMVEFAKQGKDAPEALKETTKAVGDLLAKGDEAAAIDMAAKLFGTRGAGQFVDAVKTGAFSVDDLNSAIGATGDTILGVEEQTRTFKDQWNLFKQQAGVALEPLGKALMSVLVPAVEAAAGKAKVFSEKMQGMGQWVKDNSAWLGPLVAGLGALAGQFVVLGGAMKFITAAKAAGGIMAMAKATKLWTGVQTAFNLVMAANPIVLIGAAIAAAGVALWAFFTKTEKGREIWGKFTDFMKTAWEATTRFFKDAYSAYIEPVFDWIGDKWESLKSLFSAGFGEDSNLGGMFTTLKDAVGVAVDWIGQKWAELGPAMSQIYDTWIRPVIDFFKAGIDLLSTAISWWINNITKPALDLLGQAFQLVWNTFIKPVIDGFKTGVDLLGQIFQIIINGVIVPAWQFMGDMFMSVWTNIVNPVWEFMKNLVGVLADVLTGNFDNIKNRFSDMGRNIHDIVMGVVKSAMDFFRGLVEMVGNAWQTFKDIVQTVVDVVKQKIQEMVDRLSQFPGQVQNLFSQAGQWLVSAGRNIINGLWNGMKSAWSSVKNWLSENLSFSAIGSLVGLRSGGIVVNAEGGIMRAYIDGGIDQLEQYANGGRRGERHVAQIAPAGSWRVWAEPETGGEAYIPLARSKRGRSTAILDEVAGRFGYQLVNERTGRPYDGNYSGNLGPQHVTQFADGGVVTGDDLRRFAEGEGASQPLEGAPYVWGGSNWGDCSGTASAFAAKAVGIDPFPRKFATASEASWLSSHGFQRGHGGPGDLRIGFRNGGPAGGHTSGTLPDGTNFEMGGARGNGQLGGGAAGADDSYYNEFFYISVAPAFEDVQLDDLGDLSPDEQMAAYAQNPDAVNSYYAEQAEPYVADSMPDTSVASEPQAFGGETTISGAAGSVVQELVTGQVGDALAVFGVPDTIPSWLIGAQKLASKFWNGPDKKYSQGDNPGTSTAEQHAIENHDAAVTSMTPTELAADPQLSQIPESERDVIVQPEVPEWGPEFFAYEISRAAIDSGFNPSGDAADAAQIGLMTALVESGDPMQMYANNSVPESLNYRHDAVGSDYDSVGLFQQRDNGAWGTVAQRMDPYESAKLFYRELSKFDWKSMEPGDAAQKVQRSAFPDRYAAKMDRAGQLYGDTGLFTYNQETGRNDVKGTVTRPEQIEAGVYDNGGVLKHGAAAFNFSKKPEAILTNEQWEQLQGMADSAMNSDLAKELTTAINGGTGEDGQKHGGILKDIQGVTMGNIRQQLPNLARQIVSGTVRTGGTLALTGAKAGVGLAGAGLDAGIGAATGAASSMAAGVGGSLGAMLPGIGTAVSGAMGSLGALTGFSSAGDALSTVGTAAIDMVGQPVVDMAAWYTGEVAAGWTDAFLQYGEQLFGSVEAPFQDILGPVSSAVNQVSSKVNEMPIGGGTVGASESQGEQQSGSLRGPTTVINVHSVAEALEMQRHAERRELAGFGLGR